MTMALGMIDLPLVRDPRILGGTPVFSGTRVPVRILMDYLVASDSLDVLLDHYPSVSREQAIQVIERAIALLLSHGQEAAT